MTTYKTYQAAKMAKPDCDIYECDGGFGTELDLMGGIYAQVSEIKECNPADYCETVYDFHKSGKLLVDGDSIILPDGDVCVISDDSPSIGVGFSRTMSVSMANTLDPFGDKVAFVLKAAAYDVETEEEKEAFDMIDTTARQVESLANSSEIPDGSESPEDDECPYVQIRRLGDQLHNLLCEIQDEPIADELSETVTTLWSVETPKQKAERERLEAAYDLYCTCGIQHETVCFEEWSDCYSDVWLSIVDKTGYRKQ